MTEIGFLGTGGWIATKERDNTSLLIQHEKNLVLVTCYPFGALTAGGASRYLVYASAMPENTDHPAAM